MKKQITLLALFFAATSFATEETPSFSAPIKIDESQITKTELNPYERPSFERKKTGSLLWGLLH